MSTTETVKTALVTGCSSGIGHAAAIELSKRGYKVYACARRLAPMQDLATNHNVTIFKMDVSDLESVENAKKFILEQLGDSQKLDILYNNAGQSCTMPAIDVNDEQIEQCFQVNVFGVIRVTRTFIDLVINAKGTVVITGSLAGICPFPWGSVYGASKAAIHQYASGLALELEPLDVKVLNVITGGVDTNIADVRPIPKSSIYNLPETTKAFKLRQEMAVKNTPQSPEVYVQGVINEIEKGKRGRVNIFKGTYATTLSFLVWLLPRSVILLVFRAKFHLNDVWKAVRESQETQTKKSI
ncbi:hypothetical protein CANARDRAFT_198686 [[Candida] arabinofermentans NRRL YB-2248]|uniref:NADPH-dependent 1-acyldihydroxyacetone phosphate reductase n=1 Tax=[Candida] arabinofermentans NRRL YB-2248 TaxID=983967 RepID=A0A1E4T180_9ASCO|nr:hypothetical protein CANARDRAFT_198686 [[Candida] arabinofermentans NRRL YB-2248]